MNNDVRLAKVIVNNAVVEYFIEGQINKGTGMPMLKTEQNLAANTHWETEGYSIVKFLSAGDFSTLKNYITENIHSAITHSGIDVPASFKLEEYHNYVPNDDLHYSIIQGLHKGINVKKLPVDIKRITGVVEACCGVKLTPRNPVTMASIFNIRIVRPGKVYDNNPPHRDVYLGRLKNAINIYAPIAGSTADTSLALIPGSHHWNEEDIEYTAGGAVINSKKFTVPAIVSYKGNDLEMTRPNPAENEVMVFSPYLVHGAGYNLSKDTTRVSLEIRFWQRTPTSNILDFLRF